MLFFFKWQILQNGALSNNLKGVVMRIFAGAGPGPAFSLAGLTLSASPLKYAFRSRDPVKHHLRERKLNSEAQYHIIQVAIYERKRYELKSKSVIKQG